MFIYSLLINLWKCQQCQTPKRWQKTENLCLDMRKKNQDDHKNQHKNQPTKQTNNSHPLLKQQHDAHGIVF